MTGFVAAALESVARAQLRVWLGDMADEFMAEMEKR
jgi:hypothetical protein